MRTLTGFDWVIVCVLPCYLALSAGISALCSTLLALKQTRGPVAVDLHPAVETAERARRMLQMRERVLSWELQRWAESFLDHAQQVAEDGERALPACEIPKR